MKFTCLDCSLSFTPFTDSTDRCGACQIRATGKRLKFINCSICGDKMHCSRSTRLDGKAAHQSCRRTIHGTSGYSRGCRCDECRSAVAQSMRQYSAERKAKDGISPTAQLKRKQKGYSEELMSCALCGERLSRVPANGKRGYHRECRKQIPTWMARGEPGPKQRRIRTALRVAARGRVGGRLFTQGKCGWCGDAFTSPGGSFFCDAECRRRRARRDRGSLQFIISPTERHEIYERDGWVCQLCKRPVDADLSNPDIWSASLDHIIPQSSMLVPDHSPQNLRLAHLVCNSYRGEGEVSISKMRKLTESRWKLSVAA